AGGCGEGLAALEGGAMAVPAGARRALFARGQALLGQRPPDEAFGEAIERAPAAPPFQRARTELLYGEWLRRDRRRTEARGHLRAALELFHRLGGGPWAGRAAARRRAPRGAASTPGRAPVAQPPPPEQQAGAVVSRG